MPTEKFVEAMSQAKVRHDTRLLGDFVEIWCDGHHADRRRRALVSDAAGLGVYRTRTPALCDECADHARYAEKRRAYCPQDPKPFCANCPTHCYKSDEADWQREMMRYSGPRSWRSGYAIDGVMHMLESRKARRKTQGHAAADAAE